MAPMKQQILADKKSTNGNRYRLVARGGKFDVLIHDVYTWRYKLKANISEMYAREYFGVLTL
jgi:hypothetical protein